MNEREVFEKYDNLSENELTQKVTKESMLEMII